MNNLWLRNMDTPGGNNIHTSQMCQFYILTLLGDAMPMKAE